MSSLGLDPEITRRLANVLQQQDLTYANEGLNRLDLVDIVVAAGLYEREQTRSLTRYDMLAAIRQMYQAPAGRRNQTQYDHQPRQHFTLERATSQQAQRKQPRQGAESSLRAVKKSMSEPLSPNINQRRQRRQRAELTRLPTNIGLNEGTHRINTMFPSLLQHGYNAYSWVPPDRDIENNSGYFSIVGNTVEPLTLVIDGTMLATAARSDESMFLSADPTTESNTTFQLFGIPVGSTFRWHYGALVWVYQIVERQSGSINYMQLALNGAVIAVHLEIMLAGKPDTDTLLDLRLQEQSQTEALVSARKLKEALSRHDLNIVTAESLTSGMIAKMLIDIPRYGANVYGGFAVYDTDAKRKFLGVKTTGVYSHATAAQMALGALNASRATISVAVTGNAMTMPDEVEHMGEVYIGVAIRSDPPVYATFREDFCKGSVGKLCDAWKRLHSEKDANGKYTFAPAQMTSMLADFIRYKTVQSACDVTVKVINRVFANSGQARPKIHIASEDWDRVCQPSWILNKYIDGASTTPCDPFSDKDYD